MTAAMWKFTILRAARPACSQQATPEVDLFVGTSVFGRRSSPFGADRTRSQIDGEAVCAAIGDILGPSRPKNAPTISATSPT
jgi:hypothetical protein